MKRPLSTKIMFPKRAPLIMQTAVLVFDNGMSGARCISKCGIEEKARNLFL